MYATGGSAPMWLCPTCNEYWAIMNGHFRPLPKRGKLSDWPELEQKMHDILDGRDD